MLTILEFLDSRGASPFAAWFDRLDAAAAAKVTTAVRRLELGNFSNVKGSEAASLSTASILGLGIVSISAKTVRPW